MKLLSIGNLFHSVALYAEDFAEIDGEQDVKKYYEKTGGAAVVVASIISNINESSYIFTCADKSEETKRLIERLKINRVNTGMIKYHDNPPNKLISIYNNKNDRQCYAFYSRPLNVNDFYNFNFSDWDIIFFCCLPYSLIKEISTIPSFSKAKVVLLPSGLAPSYFHNCFCDIKADYFFANKGEAINISEAKTETEIFSKIQFIDNTELILTDGKKGAIVLENNKLLKIKPPEDVKIRHAGGAGDAFAVGYIVSKLNGNSNIESILKGHKMSSNVLKVVDPTINSI